jgi:hypothetical protein
MVTRRLGDEASTFFWTNNWLPDGRICELAPNLFAAVRRSALRQRRVREGLAGSWLDDVPLDLSALAVGELFQLADRLTGIALAENKCWTADRLSRRGLPHPATFPFCDQEAETLDHLLLGCVLTRQVWATCLRWWGKIHWMLHTDTSFVPWLQSKQGGPGKDRDLWTAVTLVCWCLWRHRNDIVFEGATPSLSEVVTRILDEAELWRVAGLFRGSLVDVGK